MNRPFSFSCTSAVLSAACVFLAAGLAQAQVAGTLTGSVVDAQGAPIPNASVKGLLAGGQQAVLSTATNTEGFFSFAGVRPEFYDLTIEASGFVKTTLRQVKIDPASVKALPPIKLEIASVAETIEVTAEVQNIQTANAEIATTVTNQQIRNLPVLDRQVINLITTQAGVTDGRGATVINGMRTSYATVTMDGINIQDNFIRSNGLSFIPNRITVDQVAEVTISTSNANATIGGGSAQVSFVSPSGTNEYHGNAYWYNRNNLVAANDWFNNLDGVEKPDLNQNQFGGSLGGPIVKDKLLFYFNYEELRLKQQELANTTILTQDARNGIYTYRDTAGATQKVNILQARGVSIDPAIASLLQRVPEPSKANNFRVGDSTASFLRNNIGYSFNKRSNNERKNLTSKVDYVFSEKQSFSGSYIYNSEKTDRPDQDLTFNVVPSVANDSGRHLVSVGWRWTPGPTLTNELRGGFNFSPGIFANTEEFPEYLLARPSQANTVFTYPVNNTLLPQGRYTDTYVLQDNATWMKGRHNIRFGWQSQMIRVEPYNDAGIYPSYTMGISANNTNGLTQAQLPGISANDLTTANNMLAWLAGYVSSGTQTFNVTSRDSGFVPGATDRRNWNYDNHAFYLQDEWKTSDRLTLNLGLRYEFFTRADEVNGLALLPRLNGNFIDTLKDPNGVLDFAGGTTGRQFYDKDLNNFAPNVGLAWDVFGNRKTALRAGYSMSYVNDDHIAAVRNTVVTNSGLAQSVSLQQQNGRLSSGRPIIPTPTFKVPRTYKDNNLADATSAFGLPDPSLRTPYIQQWTFGLQHDIKGFIVEGRYVGNKGTKLLRAFDYNQVNINASGFLDDFKRARNNGFLARNATGTFNPVYNAAIPGSVPLTVFPQLSNQGNLGNATVRGQIERGEVGTLAQDYFTGRVTGVNFFPNPNALALNSMTNYSNSTYNALQVEVRKRTASGFQLQANYTYGKVLSDAAGDGQTRFEPFLDINNGAIEKARAPFDLNHAFKANFVYPLPFGKGTSFDYKPLSRVISGWMVGGFATWQAGTPFSIFSERGTLNRGARSTTRNTATAIVDGEALKQNIGFFQTGDGPYFVNPSAIGSDGRGVASDGRATFAGQMFANPGPGEVGSLQRRMFSGPSVFNMDFTAAKTTQVTEKISLQLRMEAFNFFNNASFYVGDEIAAATRFNVNNTTFGLITSTFFTSRVMQFGLYLRF